MTKSMLRVQPAAGNINSPGPSFTKKTRKGEGYKSSVSCKSQVFYLFYSFAYFIYCKLLFLGSESRKRLFFPREL